MQLPLHNLGWLEPYGTLLALAVAAEWWLARRRAQAEGLDASHIDLVLPLTFVAALLAAPLLGSVVPQEHFIAGDALPVSHRLRLPAVLGAGVVVVWAYGRLARIPVLTLLDVLAAPTLLFVAVLRIGCLLAGCCFGDVVGHADAIAALTDPHLQSQVQTIPALSLSGSRLAITYDTGSPAFSQHQVLGLIGADARTSLPVHPVQLYESLAAGLLCLATLRIGRRHAVPGMVALFAFTGFSAATFALQFLRADSAPLLGALTANQLFFLVGLGFTPAAFLALRHKCESGARGRAVPCDPRQA